MNAVEVLRPPWLATSHSSRWLAAVGVLTLTIVDVLVLIFVHALARTATTGIVWCCALALWWSLVVPNVLWLGRDAAALQLPHVRHLANASVLAHAVLTVAIPATVFSLALGHALVWYVGFTLVATGCMLFLLLPSGVWIVLWVAVFVVVPLQLVHFRPAGLDRLAWYGVVPALAILGLAAWRWFRVLDMPTPAGTDLAKPVIWNLRTQAKLGFFGPFGHNADIVLARNVHPWLAPVVDLRRTGPQHPVRTLRVALSRNTAPRTPANRLQISALWIGYIAILLIPAALQAARHHPQHWSMALRLSASSGYAIAMSMATVIPVVATTLYGWTLASRWTAANNELPLLYLLPRLSDPLALRRSAVVACLNNVFYAAAGELAILSLGGWLATTPATALLLATLCAASTVALTAVPILRTLGGRPLPGWLLALLIFATAGVSTGAIAIGYAHGGASATTVAYLAIALLILLAGLIALDWCGWRALQRRPHPFLANTK